jgi:fermentation-respiration switch protein FrsA (DUF1100 family)
MWKRRGMHTLLLIVIGIVAIILWLRWNEPRMLYYPLRQIDQTPDQLGLKYEDVYLTTSDRVKINGWFVPSPSPRLRGEGSGEGPTPLTILFLHGNAGNISHRFEKLEILRSLGVDTFIIDYRGYGRSEGKPNEQGTYRDAEAAYDYLTKTLNREPGTIIVYGESLGAAVAIDLAARVPVGGVIVEEAFTSVPDMAQGLFPFLPGIRWFVRNRYDSLSKIAGIKAPLLAFHSPDDEVTPFVLGQRLFAAAREPKRFVELRGGHNGAFVVSAETYRAALKSFFDKLRGA